MSDRKQQEFREGGTEEFVGEDSSALRIVRELHNVIAAIGAAHQMRLAAATHPPNFLDGPQRASGQLYQCIDQIGHCPTPTPG
jgi:hypothetical protein